MADTSLFGTELRRPPWTQLAVPAGVLLLVGTILLPVPPVVLDVLLTLNLTGSLLLLMAVLFADTPLSLTVFPTVLLLITALRLSLNIASTRLILGSGGADGTLSAGHVIEALGVVVVGGNFVVGLILFGVIMVIQYVVINHGAVRISEVSARFVLDAMPGKQMAIDADLNAGLIDERQARERRLHISTEAEFYGHMDGAVRFTQRDAIAGIIIVTINIVAGLVIGVLQQGMGIAEAFETFTTLTIGDGLANAVPSLLVSIAAGLLTTRASAEESVSEDVATQLLTRPGPLWGGSALLAALALAPGFPKLPFLFLAGIIAWFGRRANQIQGRATLAEAKPAELPAPPEPLEKLVTVDRLGIQLGFQLVTLVGQGETGLPARLKALRRELAGSTGLVLPMVRVTDNPDSTPNGYVFLLKGAAVAKGELMPGHVLVVDSGTGAPLPPGVVTRDPAFQMPAVWVRASERGAAEAAGHMVIDPLTVLITHFSEVIKTHGHELLGRQEIKSLLDVVAESHPKVVEELKAVPLGEIQKVLSELLKERVPIRDLVTIFETLTDTAAATPNRSVPLMTEQVRIALRRTVVTPYLTAAGELHAVTTSPQLESTLVGAIERSATDPSQVPSPADFVGRLQQALGDKPTAASPVILTSPRLRQIVRSLVEPYLPSLAVISHAELPPGVRVVSLGMVV